MAGIQLLITLLFGTDAAWIYLPDVPQYKFKMTPFVFLHWTQPRSVILNDQMQLSLPSLVPKHSRLHPWLSSQNALLFLEALSWCKRQTAASEASNVNLHEVYQDSRRCWNMWGSLWRQRWSDVVCVFTFMMSHSLAFSTGADTHTHTHTHTHTRILSRPSTHTWSVVLFHLNL